MDGLVSTTFVIFAREKNSPAPDRERSELHQPAEEGEPAPDEEEDHTLLDRQQAEASDSRRNLSAAGVVG